jgi:glycosyl transferase family 25
MPTPVRAIGITHPGSPRCDRFVAMLEGLGIPYELRPAVFVQGELPWSRHYDHGERMRNLGYPMRAGEVGCFLAHRGVWAAASCEEGCSLVLEDDAFVDPSRLPDIMAAAQLLVREKAAARLISQPRPSFRSWRSLSKETELVRPVRNGNLTVGYLITRKGAASLLRYSESFWCPVDDYMNLGYVHGCLMFHFEPEIAEHRDGGVSLIGQREKPSVSLQARVVREALRAWRNLRGRLHSWMTLVRLGLCFSRVRRPADGDLP